MKKGEVASLRLALSHTFDINLLMPHLNEVRRRFERLECRLLRGTASEVVELLKSGEAELGIASDLGEGWDRLDRWPLFTEDFILMVNAQHRLARAPSIELADLREERLLLRTYCEHAEPTAALLRTHGIDVDHCFQIASEHDLMSMLASDLGVAIVPRTTSSPTTLARVMLDGFALSRPVQLYGVAGRQRTAVAALVMKMLRAADWSRHEHDPEKACPGLDPGWEPVFGRSCSIKLKRPMPSSRNKPTRSFIALTAAPASSRSRRSPPPARSSAASPRPSGSARR